MKRQSHLELPCFIHFLPGFGVLVAAMVPKTSLSPIKRIGGIALALFCIAFDLVFDYLQARYR